VKDVKQLLEPEIYKENEQKGDIVTVKETNEADADEEESAKEEAFVEAVPEADATVAADLADANEVKEETL